MSASPGTGGRQPEGRPASLPAPSGPTSRTSTAAPATVVLEQDQRLSLSCLWQRQRRYYEQQGVGVWARDAVPHYITANPFIARAYGRVVRAWLQDWQAAGGSAAGRGALEPNHPVYVVELGAGSGRFAYHFLRWWHSGAGAAASLGRLTYVLTDVAERTIDFWRSHPALRPFVEAGQVDFARFDAEEPRELELVESGVVLEPGTASNPLVLLANYVFDSIPHDAFSVVDGELRESRVTLTAEQDDVDLDDPALLARLSLSFSHHPITGEYYGDPELNRLLRHYQQRLAEATFLLPIAALRCLSFFRQVAGGRLLLLSADKGFDREQALTEQPGPGIGIHDGAFSVMVNYHAIGQFVHNAGGQVLRSSHQPTHLTVMGGALGLPPRGLRLTRQAYAEAIADFGPDDFFLVRRMLERQRETMSLEEMLACLRLSGWDATLVLSCYPTLLQHLESATPAQRQELFWAIERVGETYYWIGEDIDVPACLATLLSKAGYVREALRYLRQSLTLHGPRADTYHNLALCHAELRQLDEARRCVEQALALDPTLAAARALRATLLADREDEGQETTGAAT